MPDDGILDFKVNTLGGFGSPPTHFRKDYKMANVQYLVTSSGTIERDGLVKFNFKDMTVGEDMPSTFEDAAHMAYDHCRDDKSLRVLFLNHVDGKLSDVTDEIVYFVALNLIDLNDDDVSVPEWAESAFNRIVKDY